MNLGEFVDGLSMEAFNELRKCIIARHHRHSEEIVKALEYLTTQPVLCKAAVNNREACENVLVEKTKLPKALVVKVVNRYLQLKDHFHGDNPSIEFPFSKK